MARTTIQFNDAADRTIKRLAGKLDITKAEVIRSAISLYWFVADQLAEGGQLAIVKGNEIDKVIAVPGLAPLERESEQKRDRLAHAAARDAGRTG